MAKLDKQEQQPAERFGRAQPYRSRLKLCLDSLFKMNVKTFIAGLFFCVGSQAFGQDIVIDLRKGHDLQNVLSSGLKFQEFPSGKNRRNFVFENQKIAILLPGGREIHTKATTGSFTSVEGGKLILLDVEGPILPDNEAYEVALAVHRSFGISLDRLDEWKRNIQGKGRDAPAFSNGLLTHYPSLYIEVRPSMNLLYPWGIRIDLGWNIDDNDERDESWGEVNNQPPPNGLEKISLDSPTGRFHDRKEAYKDIIKAQEDFDKKMGQVRDVNGNLINASHVHGTAKTKAPESSLIGKPASPTSWRIIVVLIVVANGLLWLLVKKRK